MAFFSKFPRKLIGILLLISGSVCLLGGGATAIYSYHFSVTAQRTTGEVIQLIQRRSNGADALYPVFRYTDRNGVSHTVDSNTGSYPAAHQIGDSVTVLYVPGSENSAEIGDWFNIWGISLVLGIIGISHLAIGIVLCLWLRISSLWRSRASR